MRLETENLLWCCRDPGHRMRSVKETDSQIQWGFFPWPAPAEGKDGTEGVMIGAQGFGITESY